MAALFSPSLVIFDCDGVLVDTEPVANRLLVRLLGDVGYEVTYEECRRLFVGRSLEAVVAHVEAALGRSLGAHWPDMIREESLKAFAQGEVQAVPGVEGLVRSLRIAQLPYCVASSGRLEKMRFTLGASGLLPLMADALVYEAEEWLWNQDLSKNQLRLEN